MNCERCHKNHATLHLTAIENDVKREIHLCEDCARQTGVNLKFNFSVNDYEIFRTELLRLLDKVHGATSHAGKTPCTVEAHIRKENELMRLKRDLEAVVKSEDFEKAAQIRDRIRSIELELNR
jgi:protein arginine kinase activator